MKSLPEVPQLCKTTRSELLKLILAMPNDLRELLAELRAIEVWDADYLNNAHPFEIERAAWTARRFRHREIIQLVADLNSLMFDSRYRPTS
jgi:hypothetical protein